MRLGARNASMSSLSVSVTIARGYSHWVNGQLLMRTYLRGQPTEKVRGRAFDHINSTASYAILFGIQAGRGTCDRKQHFK